jgi:hypothetical protein
MNQLHVAFINLHNRLVDRLRDDGEPEEQIFDEARRAATWHYQHVIAREFLPLVIGPDLTAQLLDGGATLYRLEDDGPYIPFEFADAAYRYGHSQIRQRYIVNERFGPVPVFPDLIGFGPVEAERVVDWSLQIDVPGGRAQRAKKIDGRLPRSLIDLPTQISGAEQGSDYASLATRDLERGTLVGLPSGETVARELGVEPLTPEQVGLPEDWSAETPLWFYILKEADAIHGGEQLGPVGGRIVGEVLVGILDADPESFRSVEPDWAPTLPRRDGVFGLAEILIPVDD